jgi:hypothetical protein
MSEDIVSLNNEQIEGSTTIEEAIESGFDEVFEEKETADRVSLRFGIFEDAMQEPDIEERFIRAQAAADSIKGNPQKKCGFYEFDKK